MSTLADVFREINALKADAVVRDYALGGATATLFYAEPSRTYDVDVFVLMPPAPDAVIVSLETLYDWARARGFGLDAEHILIHGVPVQFLPAHNALAEAAVETAGMVADRIRRRGPFKAPGAIGAAWRRGEPR
jgi:hypothetical protein